MSPNTVCPSCGAALEENVGSSCPYCGSALSVNMSAPTIISAPKKKKATAQSSAEAMDEVKKLVGEGETAAAAEVASAEFGLDQEAAQNTVEQVATEMKYSAPEPTVVEPEPVSKSSEPIVENIPPEEPKKPSTARNWIIGGSVAAVIFLCCCCCMPFVIAIVAIARNQ
jgi:hypothetical protein